MLKLETLPVLAKSPLNVPFPFQGPLNFKFLPVTHFEYIRIIYVGVLSFFFYTYFDFMVHFYYLPVQDRI